MRAACGSDYVAVHIRRTDHQCPEARRTHDGAFHDFLERHASSNIYLATDNAVTREAYRQRYGSRIKACTPVASGTIREEQPERHTPVAQAVIDIFVCVYARTFKGSYYSSFSDAIAQLRRVHELASEEDEHDLTSRANEEAQMMYTDASLELPEEQWQRARVELAKATDARATPAKVDQAAEAAAKPPASHDRPG